jgi:hypothetical protein
MSKANGDIRIGVYVCHCGTNIAAVVDVKALAEPTARPFPTWWSRGNTSTCVPIPGRT